MIKEKKLEQSDRLIYTLYKKLGIENDAHFILEKDSIKEEEKGIKLTIIEPMIEWTNGIRQDKNKKREFLITEKGNVEVLSEKNEDIETEETIDEFLNKTNYKIEPCTEDLLRMTKEKASISLETNGNSLEKVRTITPSIIYLSSFGEVLDIISLKQEKAEEKPKVYTRKPLMK